MFANDSAAGITATGIYFKEEKNISIEKEELFISEEKIEGSYIFKNHSTEDITTEIAFPMPDYDYDISGTTVEPMYDDFTVEINGKKINHKEESRAFVNKTDYTKLLNEMGVSIKDFGNFYNYDFHEALGREKLPRPKYFFESLSQKQKQLLLKAKLVVNEGNIAIPNWTVSRKYYWTQTFPAKGILAIKHSYSPYKSFDYVSSEETFYKEACIDKETDKWLKGQPYPHYYRFVDYILTTANNWKQPIKTFRLIVNSGGYENSIRVSSCFPKKLIKTTPSLYEATVTNFVPKQNITIYFIGH